METEMGNKEVVLRLSGHREGATPVGPTVRPASGAQKSRSQVPAQPVGGGGLIVCS